MPARAAPSGMPEAGYLPIPKKLARAGVKDMVRISDARMSGTAYGTIVLHVTPEAAQRRPARAGAQRRPHPPLGRRSAASISWWTPEELARRPAAPPPIPGAATPLLYRREILQADRGCDFDFLRKHPLGPGEGGPRGGVGSNRRRTSHP